MQPSADLTPAVALFHSLSDPTRLAILERLAEGEARVVDLTSLLGGRNPRCRRIWRVYASAAW